MQNRNKNLLAIQIGFFLIILIGLITIFRSSETSNNVEDIKYNESELEKIEAKFISPSDLALKLTDKNLEIIDTRIKAEFQNSHILNSTNIPFSDLEKILPKIAKDKQYVFINANNSETDILFEQKILDSLSIPNAMFLDGGFENWQSSFSPTVSSGNPQSFEDVSKVSYISADKLHSSLEKDGLFLIDLRSSAKFSEGNIKNSVNISLDQLEDRRREIPFSQEIVVYSDDPLFAFQGAVRLYDLGYFQVKALANGLSDWQNKGYELER